MWTLGELNTFFGSVASFVIPFRSPSPWDQGGASYAAANRTFMYHVGAKSTCVDSVVAFFYCERLLCSQVYRMVSRSGLVWR